MIVYQFHVGQRVMVGGKFGEIDSMVPGSGDPWYYIKFDDGSTDRFQSGEISG